MKLDISVMRNGNGGGKGLMVRHKILFGREFAGAKSPDA